MLYYTLQGLLIGFAYVAPIGAQNLYVINNALNKHKPFQTAFITAFWDISLALSCFYGIGYIIDQSIYIRYIMLIIGSLFMIMIGIKLFNQNTEFKRNTNLTPSTKKIIITCFTVTFLNPQAIIDGTSFLGGMKASLDSVMSVYFIIGTSLASLLWFSGLSTIIFIYRVKLTPNILKIINKVASIIMIFYGINLGYQFFQLFFT